MYARQSNYVFFVQKKKRYVGDLLRLPFLLLFTVFMALLHILTDFVVIFINIITKQRKIGLSITRRH